MGLDVLGCWCCVLVWGLIGCCGVVAGDLMWYVVNVGFEFDCCVLVVACDYYIYNNVCGWVVVVGFYCVVFGVGCGFVGLVCLLLYGCVL